MDFSGLVNVNLTTRYITSHILEFKEILQLVFQSHFKYEESQKVNLQHDPWENYLYYDSKFLFDFIFAKAGRESFSNKSYLQLDDKQGKILIK